MKRTPAIEPTERQSELEKKANLDVKKKVERHEDLQKKDSTNLKKRLQQETDQAGKDQSVAWCQLQSVEQQCALGRYIDGKNMRFAALRKDHRRLIRETGAEACFNPFDLLEEPGKKMNAWCVEDLNILAHGLDSEELKKAVPAQENICAAILFGGYVVDGPWIQKAKTVWDYSGQLPEPQWHLRGSVHEPLEVYVTSEFRQSFPTTSRFIRNAKMDDPKNLEEGKELLYSQWVVRTRRNEIRQCVRALVLCESQAHAEKLREKKIAKQQEIQEKQALIAKLKLQKPVPLRLRNVVQDLKTAKASEVLRGTAVDPDEFFGRVVRMSAVVRSEKVDGDRVDGC